MWNKGRILSDDIKIDTYSVQLPVSIASWHHTQKNLDTNKTTFDVRVEPVMLIKFAPASVASAFAKSVFPVPGGPKSNIPLQGW